MDARGPEDFVFGAEESYGFLVGDHVRDKDAAVASMLLAELAARLKAEGKTLHQRLDELFLRYGCHTERADQRADAGRKGHGRHAGADGQVPHHPARKPRRPEGRRGPRLPRAARSTETRRPAAAASTAPRATW